MAKLRSQFSSVRKQFVKDLAADPTKVAHLKNTGMSDAHLALIAKGGVPKLYRVHLNYLRQIETVDAQFGGKLQPAASEQDLAALVKQIRERFGYELPGAYLQLLAVADGVNFNSYTLYTSKTLPITGYADRFIEGFLEANDLWEDYQENSDHHLLMFGETGGDLFLFDRRDQKFKVTDKVGGDAYQEFDSFEELAEQLFKNALGIFEENAA